ncbi:MAG: choice-of-anchor Q domain-containing protein, partial [Nocardioides sp.]|uniref:choice-of-anchor Q domain-containing protein n=1 Tax=Nocardioides sp. TaxID=35761 RepID=UPI0039E3AD03
MPRSVSRTASRTLARVSAVVAGAALPLAALAPIDLPAAAAEDAVVVTRLDDPAGAGDCLSGGDCSLRQAITEANGSRPITLPAGTYDLTLGELDVPGATVLDGAGADVVTIRQTTADSRVISASDTVTLSGLTLTGGHATSYGGGIGLDGPGTLQLHGVRVTGNTAATSGGGIGGDPAGRYYSVYLYSSTVDANTAGGDGGGIGGGSMNLYLLNSTVADNTSTAGAGGGVFLQTLTPAGYAYPSRLQAVFSTVAGNTAGRGSAVGFDTGTQTGDDSGGSLELVAAAVAGTCARSDGSTAKALTVYTRSSVLDDATCPLQSGDTTSALVADLGLTALGDHGGPLPTRAPQAGSPLIDAVEAGLADWAD